jgi:hypothetical protein
MRSGERHDVAVGGLLAVAAPSGRSPSQALGQLTLLQTLGCSRMNFRNSANSGPSTGLRHVGPAHVVDHHRGGQRGEEVPQLGQVDGLEVDHHVPAQRADAVGDLQQFVLGREVRPGA